MSSQGDKPFSTAEQRMQGWSLFSSKETCALYEQAAEEYKKSQEWSKAGRCYAKAADICRLQRKVAEATMYYDGAIESFQSAEESTQDILQMYKLSISLQTENKRFAFAARLSRSLALLEEKQGRTKESLEAWTAAAESFEASNAQVSANQARLRVAELLCEKSDEKSYLQAIDIYEKRAKWASQNSLGKFSVKDYLLAASLLGLLVTSVTNFAGKLEEYKKTYSSFALTRECKLVEKCLEACQTRNMEQLNSLIQDYEQVAPMEDRCKKLVLKINTMLT